MVDIVGRKAPFATTESSLSTAAAQAVTRKGRREHAEAVVFERGARSDLGPTRSLLRLGARSPLVRAETLSQTRGIVTAPFEWGQRRRRRGPVLPNHGLDPLAKRCPHPQLLRRTLAAMILGK
jgi:hypothetical protein